MAFKLKSGNGGAFKAGQQLWKPPESEEESNNVIGSGAETTEGDEGEDSEARTTARSSETALSQLISPKEQKRGGLNNPTIKKRAEIRGQRYNQAVDSEMGVEGVEGPADFKGGFKEGSSVEAWGLTGGGGFMGLRSMFAKKKKYK